MAKCIKAMVIWPPSGREGDHRRWWKEPASIESNVFVKNGCIISRWLLQSRFARQLPPGGSPLFRSRVFFIKLYLCKITTAIFEIDFVSKLRFSKKTKELRKGLFLFLRDGHERGEDEKQTSSPAMHVVRTVNFIPYPLRVRRGRRPPAPRIASKYAADPHGLVAWDDLPV